MTGYTTISKDLTEVVAELEDYLTATNFNYLALPPIRTLGTAETLADSLPKLSAMLAELNLSFKEVIAYTAYPIETVSYATSPAGVIPLRNFQDMSLRFHTVNPDAVLQSSEFWAQGYYDPSETTEIDSLPYQENTLYFVDANVFYSTRVPFRLGLIISFTFNEDVSNLFV